jgi:hypothetical protein
MTVRPIEGEKRRERERVPESARLVQTVDDHEGSKGCRLVLLQVSSGCTPRILSNLPGFTLC